jgi:hypothetical protein
MAFSIPPLCGCTKILLAIKVIPTWGTVEMSRPNMPGPVRAGLFLLVLGSICVGIGAYTDKGALSLYGFLIAIGGFLLYFISSILTRRRFKRKI